MKYILSYKLFEWQHNVPLDQSNTSNNRLDGNTSWYGGGITSSPAEDKFVSGETEEIVEKPEDPSKKIERKKKKRKKDAEEEIIALAHSEPDFLTTFKRFWKPRKPGKAG